MNFPGVDPVLDALIVVDMQPDFMPGGPLGVAGGSELVPEIARLMPQFHTVVATQDWHPPRHISFASSHGAQPYAEATIHGRTATLWPDHCIQGTAGAKLAPLLPLDRVSLVLRKGANQEIDSYSAFHENYGPDGKRWATGLMGFLFERRVRRVYICGLARDYCVKWTALDAANGGALKTTVLWDLTRPVDPRSDEAVRKELLENQVFVL